MEPDDDKTQTHIVLSKGTMVSHYRIVEKIGAGGIGEVYLAEDTQLDRKVALKFLPSHLCQDDECRKRFTREAQAVAKLNHPSIIHVYEVSEFKGRPFFAMEHVEGRTLREFSAGKDPSIEQILELGIQICEGLHAAHEKGITHRDIKPSNILIDLHGRAKIVDFGLASVVGTDQLTKTGSTLGTIGYMSPEQVHGKEVDHRSDLFSLGVVLYELITKQNPFKRDSEAATLKAASDDPPEPLARFKSGLPDGLQAIIDKVLEKDVRTRYQHADGMLSDLVRVKRSMESGGSTASVSATARRSTRSWWIAAAVVTVTAVMLGVWMSRDEAETPASTHRQITYFGDVQRCEISPDGAFYAYSRLIGEHCHLYVSDFTGGNPVELLECNYIASFRWSPDGSELAVCYKADSLWGTFLIPRLGGGSRKLSGGMCSNLQVTWSPDGDRVAIHNSCRGFDSIAMVQVTPVTISKIPLPVKGEWSTNLDWCKDGNRLLFTSNISTYNALWTIPLNGLDPVELLNGDFTCARWSADGSAIYYVEEVGLGTGPLTKMRVDGNTGGRVGDPRVLLPDLDATGLSISENNDNLLFSRRDIYSNLWYTPIGEAGREKARPLTSGTAIAFSPAISPDGQSLVYALLKEGRADIYLLPTDGGNPKRLTFDGSHNLGPAWSPDGKGIAYAGSSGGKDYNIKILNLRSGKSRTYHSPILRREDGFSGLHWGADGNIYCQGPGNRNIILLNAESGVQRELIQNEKEGWIFNARVSPDGKSVAVDWNNWVKGPGIYLLSLTDTAQVCILESESEFICHLNWSPDGEWIYCYDFKNLYRLHRTGAKLDTLAVLPFATERDFFYAALPDVAPDLGAFISVEMDVKTDVWLIENFDPDAR